MQGQMQKFSPFVWVLGGGGVVPAHWTFLFNVFDLIKAHAVVDPEFFVILFLVQII